MLSNKRFYYYKICNDSKASGLKLEIWSRTSRSKGVATFVRSLPMADVLNDFLINYDAAVIVCDKLYEAIEKIDPEFFKNIGIKK